ncbi:hypothetical protein IVB11_01995 [Bradyrhizobium sp. 177]|uniref:hypothetical protein n=1 Tax=Bradyrhizobium sp. 177 TaxID=2782647 RepID=UPI001FF95945|nr:hypothetical protein [Bradyrhizobium sp. 177]MCK1547853.1 hypothetical protein [Bradyrhizobium sp. 177]
MFEAGGFFGGVTGAQIASWQCSIARGHVLHRGLVLGPPERILLEAQIVRTGRNARASDLSWREPDPTHAAFDFRAKEELPTSAQLRRGELLRTSNKIIDSDALFYPIDLKQSGNSGLLL